MNQKKPRVLFFDIETSPNLAWVWGKWEQDVIKFKKEWGMLSFAYRWQGESDVKCVALRDFRADKEKTLLKKLWELFDKADVVIAHNGKQFDNKKVRAKFVQYAMLPPKPYKIIDTKIIAKNNFGFNSNSLGDLGEYLGLGKKKDTGGFDLWLGCMADDDKSWNKMVSYNKQDVRLLEKVYDRLKVWDESHVNLPQLIGNIGLCPTCSSSKLQSRGWAYTRTSRKPRLRCQECGHWHSGPSQRIK